MAQYQIDNVASPIDFQDADIIKRTLQNAKNLLMCQLGEVPYDRYRGFDATLYDLTMPQLTEVLLPELDRLMEWEPDVEVVDARAWPLEDGSIYILVTIDIPIGEPE